MKRRTMENKPGDLKGAGCVKCNRAIEVSRVIERLGMIQELRVIE